MCVCAGGKVCEAMWWGRRQYGSNKKQGMSRLHALVSVNARRRCLTLCASAFFSQTIKHAVQDGPQTAQRHNANG
jgi:hypothetical protein